jgi:molybdate transport system regulatory protein
MKYGAQNTVTAKVTSMKKGDVMSLVKFDVVLPAKMASVLTTDSLESLDVKPGDTVQLVIKAIHVLPVKEWWSPAPGHRRRDVLPALRRYAPPFANVGAADEGWRDPAAAGTSATSPVRASRSSAGATRLSPRAGTGPAPGAPTCGSTT